MSKRKITAEQLADQEAAKANQKAKTASREDFQKLLENAKKQDFDTDFVYVKCPEIGARIKIHNMSMHDTNSMQQFSREMLALKLEDENFQSPPLWAIVMMFSAKDEDGEYLFQGYEGVQFIASMGQKWFTRYGVKAMEMSGYTEEFRATKK